MVKLAKGAKNLAKPKKTAPPPPKDTEDSEEESEEDDDSEEETEPIPQKKTVTPAKAVVTPAKKAATPAKKAATPAKPVVAPAKKAAVAKNGKKAKQESEEEEDGDDDEEEDDSEESEEETPPVKKPTPKKPVAKKTEEKPSAKKPAAKSVTAEESEEEEDEEEEDDDEEAMDTTPAPAKAKKTPPAKAEESEEEEEDDDEEEEEDDDDDDDDDDEEEEKETVKESGKRKKELPKQKGAEAKKPKTEGTESFSLFIGNLNSAKDFDELKEGIKQFFVKKGMSVSEVRIGGSKKFGYIDFSSEEDMEKAVEFNGKKIMGLEVKLEKARSKEGNLESKKERNARTLFVKNLPYTTTSEELQELFENAIDIRVPLGNDGSTRGIAYIEFKTEAEADQALEEKQGTEVEGRSIIVDYTGDKSQAAGGKKGDAKTLIVNNLSYNATESSLQEVFEKAVAIRIPQNGQGKPKGFAFIEFSSAEEAKEAMDTCNNTEIEGRSIRLEFQGAGQQSNAGAAQTKTLFVRGLSDDTTEESLREAFDGAVGSRIATDRDTGASKGFGFVDFSTAEDAKAAKEAMEDGEIDGNKVILDFAKPKGEGGRGRGGFGRGGFGRGGGRGFGRGRGGFGGGFGGRGGGGRGGGGRGGRGGFGRGGGFRGGDRGKKIRFDD